MHFRIRRAPDGIIGEMPRTVPRLVWPVAAMVYALYFYGISTAGLLGPDEPRYASIAREMARSGDWITPRLWGEPWFEKPALLYWMEGAAFRAGLGTELAPRLPIALLSAAFLAFYWRVLKREFGARAAGFATAILGTGGAWIGFSQVGVTDLPLAASFSAAMLLLLGWIGRRETRGLTAAAALLGAAVLAKGLVPLVLALPAAWWCRGLLRRRPALARMALAFLLVALPWYLLCWLRNGHAFLLSFFWQHHFQRFTSSALMHVQPWWFYLPVFAAALLPWAPLLPLAARRGLYADPRRRFLAASVVFGFVFFSASANKLPGYLLPLVPAAAAILGLALDEARRARAWLAACALLLAIFPIAAGMLSPALGTGLTRVPWPVFHWTWTLPLAVAALVWALEARERRGAAVFSIAAAVAAGILYVKVAALPAVDASASARALWRQVAPHASETCVDGIGRAWRYGLNYYSETPLPDCSAAPRPLALVATPGGVPRLTATPAR